MNNYTKYNYDQILDEEQIGQRQYIIPELEVWEWDLDHITIYKVWVVRFSQKSESKIWIKSEIWHQEIIGRKIVEQSFIVFDSFESYYLSTPIFWLQEFSIIYI